jgi:hypothetical protein
MAKILKNFIKRIGPRDLFSLSVPHKGTLPNGALIIFNYHPNRGHSFGERLGLVVVTEKHTTPVWFCHGTGNQLVNVVRLNDVYSEVINKVSSELSKKPEGISKSQLLGLAALVGKDNFRTYNLSKITNLYILDYIPKDGDHREVK